jgi:hypothetical protein
MGQLRTEWRSRAGGKPLYSHPTSTREPALHPQHGRALVSLATIANAGPPHVWRKAVATAEEGVCPSLISRLLVFDGGSGPEVVRRTI